MPQILVAVRDSLHTFDERRQEGSVSAGARASIEIIYMGETRSMGSFIDSSEGVHLTNVWCHTYQTVG